MLAVPSGGLGLLGVGIDELNAMAVGSPGFTGAIHFSVDRFAVGAPISGALTVEAVAGQAAGDVYVSGNILSAIRVPINALAANQYING